MNPTTSPTRRDFLRAAIALGLTAGGSPARAEPASGVIVGFPLRQSTEDLIVAVLRQLQPRYRPDLGTKPIYVAGAGGASAMIAVVEAPPDGGAVLLASSSSMTLLPLVKKLAIDPRETLRPVAGIGELCYAFIVGPAVPADVKTMAEYLLWTRDDPGPGGSTLRSSMRSSLRSTLRYGVPGRGTSPHFMGLEIARLAEVPLKATGYQSALPILQDVQKGEMPAAMTLMPGAADLANFPGVRMLAVSSGKRWPGLPDVPTLLELGLAETPTVDSVGFFTAMTTPEQKAAELRDAMETALRDPAVVAAMRAIDLRPMAVDLAYPAQIAGERVEWQTRVDRRRFGFES